MTDTPEDNKTILFKRGIPKGLKGIILIGGQLLPSSIFGLKLL